MYTFIYTYYICMTDMNKSLLEIKILFTTKLFHGSYSYIHVEPNHQVKSQYVSTIDIKCR